MQEFKQAYESERAAVQLALRCRAAACKVAASSCCATCHLHMHGCCCTGDHAPACAAPPAPHHAAMKLPKFEGNHVAEANAQFAALLKEAEALEAASRTRVVEIQVWEGGGNDGAGVVRSKKCWTVAAAAVGSSSPADNVWQQEAAGGQPLLERLLAASDGSSDEQLCQR